MAMSSLSAQLALLNGASAGSAPSRRNEDEIGRGIRHSRIHGHALSGIGSASGVRVKASILYDDAKTAAEIPVSTLYSNCLEAMKELKLPLKHSTSNKLFSNSSLSFERGLATPAANAEIDAEIVSVLHHSLSPILSSEPTCLHILEYLLRKYEIHLRPLTAHALLQISLPYHHLPLFLRILQLIDLTSINNGVWSFLRPYAAKDNKQPPSQPAFFVKQASKDIAFWKITCDLLHMCTEIETTTNISHIISFVTNIHLSSLQAQYKNNGLISEEYFRWLLPYVLKAVSSSSSSSMDIKRWGYMLIATFTELATLDSKVKEVLMNHILEGFAFATAQGVTANQNSLELICNGTVALITLLENAHANKTIRRKLFKKNSHLVMLNDNKCHDDKSLVVVGCDIPSSTFQQILKLTTVLVPCIGYLWQELEVDVRSLVGGIIAMSLNDIMEEDDEIHIDNNQDCVLLLQSLLKQASLQSLLSNPDSPHSSITSSITSQIIKSYSKHPHNMFLPKFQTLLLSLQQADLSGFYSGIAHSVSDLKNKKRRQKVALLLSPVTGYQPPSSDTEEGISDKDDATQDTEDILSLLPARVAMEHSDVNIRKMAVEKLIKEDELESNIVQANNTTAQLLLHTFGQEDDIQVANSAIKAYFSLREKSSQEDDHDIPSGDVAWKALLKWSTITNQNSNHKDQGDWKEAESHAIQLCVDAANKIMVNDDENNGLTCSDASLALLLQGIVAHVQTNPEAILQPFSDNSKKPATDALSHAKNFIATQDVLLNQLKLSASTYGCGSWDSHDKKKMMQRKFIWEGLKCCFDALKQNPDQDTTKDCLRSCTLFLLKSSPETPTEHFHDKLILQCVVFCIDHSLIPVSQIPTYITVLASLPSSKLYTSLGLVAIAHFLSSVTNKPSKISKLAILLETMNRANMPVLTLSRLLKLSNEVIKSTKSHTQFFVPALALVTHTDQTIRTGALSLLSNFSNTVFGPLVTLTTEFSSHHSSLMMDGANTLPNVLRQGMKEFGSETIKTKLFQSCVNAVQMEWISMDQAIGGCRAVGIFLDILTTLGNDLISLHDRWSGVKGIYHGVLSMKSDAKKDDAVQTMLEAIVKMLKGVTVASNENSVVIHGPGRSRSYSIGGADGALLVDPYPKDMVEAIISSLTSITLSADDHEQHNNYYQSFLCKKLLQLVIGRSSWADGVFPKLHTERKREIAWLLLQLQASGFDDSTAVALMGLPLTATDYNYLVLRNNKTPSSSNGNLILTFLTDCVRNRADRLAKEVDAKYQEELIGTLFDCLSGHVSNDDEDDSGFAEDDYTRMSLLQAILSLYENSKKSSVSTVTQSKSKNKRKSTAKKTDNIQQRTKLLVGLVGRQDINRKAKRMSLSILTHLVARAPSVVVGSLLSAMTKIMSCSSTSGIGEALQVIVPEYCKHAHQSGLSIVHLLRSFVHESTELNGEEDKMNLYTGLISALLSIQDGKGVVSVASLFTLQLSSESYQMCVNSDSTTKNNAMNVDKEERSGDSISFILTLLKKLAPKDQTVILFQLLRNAGQLMGKLMHSKRVQCDVFQNLEDNSDTSGNDHLHNVMTVRHDEYVTEAMNGTSTDKATPTDIDVSTCSSKQLHSLMWVTINVLAVVRDGLGLGARKVIQNSKGTDADLCLRFWRELMQVQAESLQGRAECMSISSNNDRESSMLIEKGFWEATRSALEDCMASLQRVLPVPHFITSVIAVIKEDVADASLRKRALGLLSDRVAEVNRASPEASLFLESVPELTGLIIALPKDGEQDNSNTDLRRLVTVQQSALIAIEQIARSVCLPSTVSISDTDVFLPTLEKIAIVLENTGNKTVDVIDEMEAQLFSSAALCSATLISVLKTRCLPFSRRLVTPLISSLSTVNSWQSRLSERTEMVEAEDGGLDVIAKLLQQSILHTLVSITEVLPQFLHPYLNSLLCPSALPSFSMRSDTSVNSLAQRLDLTLATRTPSRLMIPATCKGLVICLEKSQEEGQKWREANIISSIMKTSIQESSESDISPLMNNILGALLSAYSYEGDIDARNSLLSSANETLISLVMKISEAQLRQIYARFRDWRGELDVKKQNSSKIARRFAFWNMSAVLSKELRGIFLPCLGSVINDIVDELDFAVSKLCLSKTLMIKEGKKRRKLSPASLSEMDVTTPFRPVLLCLESSLKADAIEGGSWAQAGDGQRYELLLSPLAKLLQATFLENGTLQSSSVVDCLTALTLTGNEQLWKPLNYAIVEACGSSDSDVRIVGVTALLSVLKALGEEYMILLPECLPVLSELLEDKNETIISMAKECISLGEELLGESLEDDLQ